MFRKKNHCPWKQSRQSGFSCQTYMWVNYNISLTWIVRPFGDNLPRSMNKQSWMSSNHHENSSWATCRIPTNWFISLVIVSPQFGYRLGDRWLESYPTRRIGWSFEYINPHEYPPVPMFKHTHHLYQVGCISHYSVINCHYISTISLLSLLHPQFSETPIKSNKLT